jgi:hypothetical protein
MGEEFDELPKANEAGEQEDAQKPAGGEVPPAPTNDQPIDAAAPAAPAAPQPDPNAPVDMPADPNAPAVQPDPNAPVDGVGGMPSEPPAPDMDDVQNDIIKHNIEAMKAIHDQLEGLNSMTQTLNAKLSQLSGEVEEVREPTNVEQLMNKKEVSQPYYYNLNDFWGKDNWFNQQREKEGSQGIKELPDGSFVADFDDLPQKSKIDVQNSFNDISEAVGKKKILKEWGEEQPEPEAQPQQSVEPPSQIDGRSKQTAISLIYKRISPLTQGFFRDESWENVWKIFKVFNELGLDWNITDAKYNNGMPMEWKKWQFDIRFTDNAGKPKTIFGNLTAAGAGSVEDPLDRYDITVVLS